MKKLHNQHRAKNRPPQQPQFKRWQALYLSLYSKALYVDVIRRWQGLGLSYLLLCIALLSFPFAIKTMLQVHHIYEAHIYEPFAKLPQFTVREGRMHFYGHMPYFVKNQQGEVVSILDNTGQVNRLPQLRYPLASILVSQYGIQLNFQVLDYLLQKDLIGDKQKTILFADLGQDFNFDAREILDTFHAKTVIKALILGLYPAIVIIHLVIYMFVFLPFAYIGQLVARYMMHAQITYRQACRLMMVAITPQLLIIYLALAFFQVTATIRILAFIFMIFYFCFGILAYKQEQRLVKVDG